MFAFGIWNRRDRSLFLAGDRLGEKPLFFVKLPGAFLFASEIKPLLAHPEFQKEIVYPSILGYLTFRYVPVPRTMFKNVQKLRPAHYLIYRNEQILESCY